MATKVISKYTIIMGCLVTAVVLYLAWQRQTYTGSKPTDQSWIETQPPDSSKADTNISRSKFNSETLDQKASNPEITKAFKEALMKHADTQKNIAISLIDFGYLDLAVNLYVFYEKLNLTNYLFVSSDSKACEALAKDFLNVPCVQYVFDTDAAKASSFGSSAFIRKTHRKTKIVLDALMLQFNVLLVDLDIVVFKNPFPYLDKCPDCDLQVQWDHGMACSGFYFVKSTRAGIELMETSWKKTLNNPKGLNDQRTLNAAMEAMKSKEYYKQVILPEKQFPNGFAYFHENRIMFVTDGVYPPDVYIVHDNWIISEAAKVYRFKENLMWLNDRGGYYSDTTRKYLYYTNAVLGIDKVHQLEMDALKAAFVIGRVLNRTVILPSFSCRGCNAGKFGACKVASARCSLHTSYKVEMFDNIFNGFYREHVFLMNPLVPKSLVQSKSPTVFIESDLNKKYATVKNAAEKRNFRKVIPANPKRGANLDELTTWFDQYANISVLRFDTLYGAVDIGSAELVFRGIRKKLDAAFKGSNYIQG